jgi:hypothetical protein
MKIVHVAALLLLATQSAAIAESGNAVLKKYGSATAQDAWNIPRGKSNIVSRPNECAPDAAEPVWGAGNATLGFSCHAPIT